MGRQDNHGNGGNFFDWEGFRNQFLEQGAWKDAMNHSWSLPWLDDYVKQLITGVTSSIPFRGGPASTSAHSAPSSSKIKIVETQSHIIVRIKAAKPFELRQIRFRVGGNELRMRGLPDEDEKRIRLPGIVKAKGSRAVYRDGIFEVRLPRDDRASFTDIPMQIGRPK
jgi:HSP20 family protein